MDGKVNIDKLICSLLVRHESDGLSECLTEALEDQGLRYDQEKKEIVYIEEYELLCKRYGKEFTNWYCNRLIEMGLMRNIYGERLEIMIGDVIWRKDSPGSPHKRVVRINERFYFLEDGTRICTTEQDDYEIFRMTDVEKEVERLKNNPSELERYYEDMAKDKEHYTTMADIISKGFVDQSKPLKLEVFEKCKYGEPPIPCEACHYIYSCKEGCVRLHNADKVSETK